jgi:phage-related protein
VSDFTWPVGISSSADVEPRVLETQYGGGYRQSSADGINNMLKKWSVVFNNRDWSTLTAVNNFLKSKKGYMSFTWTPPDPIGTDEGEKIVKCKKWGFNWSTGGHAIGISAEFEEVPG